MLSAILYGIHNTDKIENYLIRFSLINIMSATSVAQDLEEVDVEKQLQEQAEAGDDTSIVLSDKGDESSAEDSLSDDENIVQNLSEKIDTQETGEETEAAAEAEEAAANILLQSTVEKEIGEELAVSSSDESDEEDNETMKKLEQDINKDTLYSFHPEITQINYKELLTLSKITRNKKGLIVDPLHTTIPFLTRYEKAKILGLRAKQINHGSKPFVNTPTQIIDAHIIAKMELNAGKIPFIIRRPMPNGGSEYWQVNDLKDIA